MSKFVPKPGSFTLFDNRESKTSDKAPDYKGELVWLDGSTLELAIWIKQGQNGEFYSGSFKRKESAPPPPPPAEESSEDAPF